MNKLSIKSRRWLLGFHIFFTCAWLGGGFGLVLLSFLSSEIQNGEQFYGYLRSMQIIDDFIIIPGAVGCLLTGLLFSILTNWRFFKYRWITIKWINTIVQILFGTFFLGPWLNEAVEIIGRQKDLALQNPKFIYNFEMNMIFGAIQVVILVFQVFLSAIKPWGKMSKTK